MGEERKRLGNGLGGGVFNTLLFSREFGKKRSRVSR